MCEENDVLFRVVEWELGQGKDHETSVTIQCISHMEQALEETKEQIEKFCKDANIKVQPAVGPDIDKKILKKIHQDHIH